jgi:hypothetical protein
VLLHALASVQPKPPLQLLRLSVPHPQGALLHDAEVAVAVHASLHKCVAGALVAVEVATAFSNAGILGSSSSSSSSKYSGAPAPAMASAAAAVAAAAQAAMRSAGSLRESAVSLPDGGAGQMAVHAKQTPAHAAAAIKQMLPALQLLQLTTKPFEHDSSGMGLVTWPA